MAGPRADPFIVAQMAKVGHHPTHGLSVGALLDARLFAQTPSGRVDFANEASRRVVLDALPPARRAELQLAITRGRAGDAVPTPRSAWREVVAGAVAIALAIAGTSAWRARAAHVSAGTPVILADIENRTGDPLFDRAFLSAATVALQQSRQVALYPRPRIAQALRLMERPGADSALGESLAREVAIRENIPVVVLLSIDRFGATYQLGGRLVSSASGQDLRSEQARASSKDGVLPALDTLVARLRRDLGESREAIAQGAPLPRVTTGSLEALRAYADGQRAWARRDYAQARDDFSRAVALDSTFALAWAALANYENVQVNDRVRGEQLLQRALALRDRLTPREQLVLAIAAADSRNQREDALRLRRSLAEQFDEAELWHSYGTGLMLARRCREALPAFARALQRSPRYTNAWINTATCQQFVGDVRAAMRSYARAAALDSTVLFSGNLNHEYGIALVRAGFPDSARTAFRAMSQRPGNADRAMGYRSLAYLASYEGRLRDAVVALDSAVRYPTQGTGALSLFRNQLLLARALHNVGDDARAHAVLDSAWQTGRTVALDPPFAYYAGDAYTRLGELPRAAELLQLLRTRANPASTRDSAYGAFLEARLQLARHNPARAVAVLAAVHDTTLDSPRLAASLDAYVALGQRDSALAAARTLAARADFGEERQDDWLRSLLWVARLEAQRGDTAAAARSYDAFAARWRRGDHDARELVEARTRGAGAPGR